MAKHKMEDLRNVALVGHGASGKTTLADLLLYKTGAASRPGSVDEGSSLLDTDEDERDHKYTISSALVHIEHNGKRINLIDTPGYPEFIGQVMGALRAVETAVVVVNASAGLEVNTRRTFARAGDAGVGRMVLINKLDHENIDFSELLDRIQTTFGSACVPLNVPVGAGHNFSAVVSTLKVPGEIPKDVQADPKDYNRTVMDAIVEADEELMMRYLEGEELSPDEIAAGVSKAIAAGTLIPVFCTSSKSGVGVSEFLDALAAYGVPPTQVVRKATKADGTEVTIKPSPDEPLVAQIFKTRIDPFVAKMSFVRVYAGTLKKDQTVTQAGHSKSMKVATLLEVQGGKTQTVDEVSAGGICALVKLDELHVGDTLTKDGSLKMDAIKFPTPMIGLAVTPKTQADQQKISGSLQKIVEEDPTFKVTRDAQTKEMVMYGMSELHLKLVEERLRKRDKVNIDTHQPKIPYRETVMGAAEGHYRHKKQSGGSGQFAEVHFRIAHLPQGVNHDEFFTKDNFPSMRRYEYDPAANYAFVDRVTGGSVPNNFIPAVEKGIKDRMEKGVIAGYQVQDVTCELFFGKDHPVDSNETAFKTAASMCFRNVFQEAKPALLEPIVTIEITVPDDKVGDISSDLSTRRGRPEGMEAAPGGFTTMKAKVPLSEVMTYARDLSSITGGQGSYTLEPSHYEMVPPNEQQKIVAAAKHHEEED